MIERGRWSKREKEKKERDGVRMKGRRWNKREKEE